MADKFLTEGEWKKFAKGRDLKDAALIKALAAFEKAKKPDEQLELLATIEKEADALRKFVKGDRDFGAYLDGIGKAQEKEEKLAKAAKASEASEDEEESPTLLTTKLVPLLRELKKGEAELPVLIAVGGKEAAVLISRRAISPSRRKLLAEFLGESGQPKYVIGHCVWEANSYTFVVQTQAAGLAKKLRAAILKQTDLRAKVRVRGEDGAMDDDGEEAEGGEHESTEASTPPQAGAPGTGNSIPEAPPLIDPLKAQFDKRWAELEPLALAALKNGTGDVSKIRAVAEFVREKADASNFKAALAGSDSLEKLLPQAQQATTQTTTTPKTEGAADPAAAFNARLATVLARAKPALAGEQGPAIRAKLSEAGLSARKHEYAAANALLDEAEGMLADSGESGESESEELAESPTPKPRAQGAQVAFTEARLDWDKTRNFVQAELKKLQASILAESAEEEDFDTIEAGAPQLFEILEVLDERLIDKLDDAYNAEGDKRKALSGEAIAIIDEYMDFVNSEPLMQDIDDSGFVDLKIRSTLTSQLKSMSEKLGATMAR